MKILMFFLLIALNLLAFGISLMWVFTHRSYESFVVAITLCANLIGVLYTKPHWTARQPQTMVAQSGNVAGRDIAAGNITKRGAPPGAV